MKGCVVILTCVTVADDVSDDIDSGATVHGDASKGIGSITTDAPFTSNDNHTRQCHSQDLDFFSQKGVIKTF